MNRIVLMLVLLIISCSSVSAKCIVNTDCTFNWEPIAIVDGFSRDATLTLLSPDDVDVFYKFDDDSSWTTTVGSQSDSCPPSTGVCMTHVGNGTYRIMVDASIITSAKVNNRLCIDVRDVQGTRTVPDKLTCQDVEEGGTVWATHEIRDCTNEGYCTSQVDPTTTTATTNLTWTVNFTATTPQPIMYFPTTAEDARQSASCTMQGLRTEVTGYNTSTKVISYRALPAAPHYLCTFRIY